MKSMTNFSRSYDNPVRIVQFGEGNFLRAFWGKAIHELNAGGLFSGQICVVQPISAGKVSNLADQNYFYTVYLQGPSTEEITLVESIKTGINPYENYDDYLALAEDTNLRIMISNTTEAGIVLDETDTIDMSPPRSFPGKLLAFLHRRYTALNGRKGSGLLHFPCELIEKNGDNLKKILRELAIIQQHDRKFLDWLEKENVFFNTLVDCIVTGYPHDEIEKITQRIGYEDPMLVKAEQYQLLVIEGDDSYRHEFPISDAKMHVVWTHDQSYYREIKVRIMNGFQTMLAHCGFLAGIHTEREALNHNVVGPFMFRGLHEQIVPSLPYEDTNKNEFAKTMLERLNNPYIEHVLQDINLNSFMKFQTRIQPSLEYWTQQNIYPDFLIFSLALVLAYYQITDCYGDTYAATCCGKRYNVYDTPRNLKRLYEHKSRARENGSSMYRYCVDVVEDSKLWIKPLDLPPEAVKRVSEYIELIEGDGVLQTLSHELS